MPPLTLPKFGQLNNIYPHNKSSFLLGEKHLEAQDYINILISEALSPNIINKQNGEFVGIVFRIKEEANIVSSGIKSLSIPSVQYVSNSNVRIYRIYIPEIHASLVIPDDFYECDPTIGTMYPMVPFLNTEELTVGDLIRVRFNDKLNLGDPIGVEKISSQPLDLSNPEKPKDTKLIAAPINASPPPSTAQLPVTPPVLPSPPKNNSSNQVDKSLDSLEPEFRNSLQKFIEALAQKQLPFIITETYRSQERQNELYKIGRKEVSPGVWEKIPGQDRITDAKFSNHSSRQAADFMLDTNPSHPYWTTFGNDITKLNKTRGKPNPFDASSQVGKAAFEAFGTLAKSMGLGWGGDFPNFYDPGHVESRNQKKGQIVANREQRSC